MPRAARRPCAVEWGRSMTEFWQFVMIGLVTGLLFALIALGYTMVYGIIELINFAHGDLFMLGSFLALQLAIWVGVDGPAPGSTGASRSRHRPHARWRRPLFCAALNVVVDRAVYKPLRTAPKLAGVVSAIGVSFIFMNIGLFWSGPVDLNFPNLISNTNLLEGTGLRFTYKDLMVVGSPSRR